MSRFQQLRRRLHARQRCEMLCVCQRPLLRMVCMTDTRQQLAVREERVNLREALHFTRRDSFEDVHGPKMARVSQSSRTHQFAQGGERASVKLADASGLVVDHEGPLAPRILCRDAGWATVGMTGLRLDAAQRKHKPTGRITPIGSERQQACDIETGHHPPARAQANGPPQSRPHQAVVGQHQTFPQRRADVIDEFERCRAGAALRPVDNDEVWTNSSFQHGLAERHDSQAWPMQSLKPTGLPPDKSRNCAMKCIISTGVLNAGWRAGEMQSTPIGTPRAFAISAVTLAPGNTPPWPGLAPCDSLISTISTCGSCACAANRSAQNEPSSLRQPK